MQVGVSVGISDRGAPAVVPAPPAVWTLVAEKGHSQSSNTPTTNVDCGLDDANRFTLVCLNWTKSATGLHSIASATLGGVAGVSVGKAFEGTDSHNSEHWLFDTGGLGDGMLSLVMTKGGGVATPLWSFQIATLRHAGDADGPTLIQVRRAFETGSILAVSTDQAGDVIANFGKIGFSGTPAFVSSPTLTAIRREIDDGGGNAQCEGIFGQVQCGTSMNITVNEHVADDGLFVSVWTAP